LQEVDSLEFNANKWLLTNFDCGCMWVRDRLHLEDCLSVDPLYLKHDHQHLTADFRVSNLSARQPLCQLLVASC